MPAKYFGGADRERRIEKSARSEFPCAPSGRRGRQSIPGSVRPRRPGSAARRSPLRLREPPWRDARGVVAALQPRGAGRAAEAQTVRPSVTGVENCWNAWLSPERRVWVGRTITRRRLAVGKWPTEDLEPRAAEWGWKARRHATHSVAPQRKVSTTKLTRRTWSQKILVALMATADERSGLARMQGCPCGPDGRRIAERVNRIICDATPSGRGASCRWLNASPLMFSQGE